MSTFARFYAKNVGRSSFQRYGANMSYITQNTRFISDSKRIELNTAITVYISELQTISKGLYHHAKQYSSVETTSKSLTQISNEIDEMVLELDRIQQKNKQRVTNTVK